MTTSIVTDTVIRPHYKRETTSDLIAMKFAKGQDVWFVIEYVRFNQENGQLNLQYNYKILEGELTCSKESFDDEIGDFIMQILKYGNESETPVGVASNKETFIHKVRKTFSKIFS